MRSGGVSAADSRKSIALTAVLKNYSGTPVWQWYTANSSEDNVDGTPIEGATAASYEAPLPETPGSTLYYYVTVTYQNDSGQDVTLRSNVVKLERYASAVFKINYLYGGRFETGECAIDKEDAQFDYYSPVYGAKRSRNDILYQSVGHPIAISVYYDMAYEEGESLDKTVLQWYSSPDKNWQANGTLLGTQTRTDLKAIRDKVIQDFWKTHSGLSTQSVHNQHDRWNQLADLYFDLPEACAQTVGKQYITLVVSSYADGSDYPQITTKTVELTTVEKNEDLYEVDADGAIVNYLGFEDELTIPSSKNNKVITKIQSFCGEPLASYHHGFAKKIIVPEGVTAIGDNAFRSLLSVREVQLPSTIQTIGKRAFYETQLQTINLPEGLKSIDDSAFEKLPLSGTVSLPSTLTAIGNSAFSGAGLKQLNFHKDTFPQLGYRAFYECQLLERVVFPADATGTLRAKNDAGYSWDIFKKCNYFRSIANENSITNLHDDSNAVIIGNFDNPIYTQLMTGAVDDSSFRYTQVDGGYAIIKVLNIPENGQVTFPSAYKGENIITIGTEDGIFNGISGVDASNVRSIVLPDTVRTIGAYAFSNCANLNSAIDFKNVTYIGESAFSECIGLSRKINFKNVSYIGTQAFDKCKYITGITVKDGCCIADRAFKECISLKTVNGNWEPGFSASQYPAVPENSEYATANIECAPFYRTQYLTHFYDHTFYTLKTNKNGTHSVAGGPFSSGSEYWQENGFVLKENENNLCDYFRLDINEGDTITVPATVQGRSVLRVSANFDLAEDVHYKIIFPEGVTHLYGCKLSNASEVTLPQNSLRSIRGNTFRDNTTLQELTLPASIEELSGTFYRCRGLKVLTFETNEAGQSNLRSLGESTFHQFAFKDGTLTLPEGITEIGQDTFSNSGIKELNLPSTLRKIGKLAFSQAIVHSPLKLPEGLTDIEAEAFSGNYTTQITFPSTLKHMGERAFYKSGITEVNLAGTNLTSIPNYAFAECASLKKVTLGDKITAIGNNAFFNLKGLNELTFGSGLKTIGSYAFSDCRLRNGEADQPLMLDFPDSVEKMGDYAFYGWKDSPVSIDLKAGKLPANLKTLGKYAFEYTELTSVTIPEGLTVIPEKAFYGTNELVKVTLHNGISEICWDAFGREKNSEGKRLQFSYPTDETSEPGKLILPLSLKKLGNSSLGAASLNDITILAGVESIGYRALYSDKSFSDNLTLRFESKDDILPRIDSHALGTYDHKAIDIWCWPDSAAYNWAVQQRDSNTNDKVTITIHTYGENLVLRVKLTDENDVELADTSLYESMVWTDLTDNVTLAGDSHGWSLPGMTRSHKYRCELTFSDKAYQTYDLPKNAKLTFEFDPSVENFSNIFTYKLYTRKTITLTGTFADWETLENVSAKLYVKKSAAGNASYEEMPIEIDAAGHFEISIPRYPAYLTAEADNRMLLTVKDVQLYHIESTGTNTGKADLSSSLKLEYRPLRRRYDYDHTSVPLDKVGDLTVTSIDGSNRLGKVWVNSDGSLFLHSASDLHPGEQVQLTAVPQADSSYELKPYTFTLVSEGVPAETLTPTCAKRSGVYLDQEAQQTAIIFGADGKYVGTLRSGDKHLSNGSYTVVVISNTVYNTSRWSSYFRYFSGTIENLRAAFPDSYRKEQSITVRTSATTEITARAPEYSETGVVAQASLGAGMVEKNGILPLYLNFKLSEGTHTGGNFLIEEHYLNEHHFAMINGSYVFCDQPGAISNVEAIPGGGHQNAKLSFSINIVEGSAVAYLKAAGQTLTIYFDDGLKKTYIATVHVPAQSFSLDAPSAATNSVSGYVNLTASYSGTAQADLYVDHVLYSSTKLVSYGQGRNRLPYQLKDTSSSGSTKHSLYVEVKDQASKEVLWTSDNYSITHQSVRGTAR